MCRQVWLPVRAWRNREPYHRTLYLTSNTISSSGAVVGNQLLLVFNINTINITTQSTTKMYMKQTVLRTCTLVNLLILQRACTEPRIRTCVNEVDTLNSRWQSTANTIASLPAIPNGKPVSFAFSVSPTGNGCWPYSDGWADGVVRSWCVVRENTHPVCWRKFAAQAWHESCEFAVFVPLRFDSKYNTCPAELPTSRHWISRANSREGKTTGSASD